MCYYGIPTGPWDSSASRMLRPGEEPVKSNESIDFTILDVSGYEPPRVTSNPLNLLTTKTYIQKLLMEVMADGESVK